MDLQINKEAETIRKFLLKKENKTSGEDLKSEKQPGYASTRE